MSVLSPKLNRKTNFNAEENKFAHFKSVCEVLIV